MAKIEIIDLVGSKKMVDAKELKELINQEIETWDKVIKESRFPLLNQNGRALINIRRPRNKWKEIIYYKPLGGTPVDAIFYKIYGSYYELNYLFFPSDFNDIYLSSMATEIREAFSKVLFTDGVAFQGLKSIVISGKAADKVEELTKVYTQGIVKYFNLHSYEENDLDKANSYQLGYVSALVSQIDNFNVFFDSSLRHGANESSKILDSIRRAKINAEDELSLIKEEFEARAAILEKSHGDLLRLKKPAQYWGLSAKKYRRAGEVWTAFLVISVVVGFIGFSNLFMYWLENGSKEISLITAQSAIFIMLGSAAYFYFVRVCSRIIFSSFHLMRDAEEREQLTHVYLSLIKDGSIDSDARSIVLQSLFSRTDTGLLGGDSSPTMPAVDILKALKNDKT